MQLRFICRNGDGVESERTLIKWNENSRYINGRSADDSLPKTYRKDRIVEFLQGGELLLIDAASPAPRATSDQRPQIQFTGFSQAEKAELQALVDAHGLWVMSKAGKNLAFLCCGSNAGPVKLRSAHDTGPTRRSSVAKQFATCWRLVSLWISLTDPISHSCRDDNEQDGRSTQDQGSNKHFTGSFARDHRSARPS